MPLNQPALKNALQTLAEGPGATDADCAQAWAQAVQVYAAGIVPPSAALVPAVAALQSSLATAFTTSPCAAGMETAFATFAAALGVGMAPAFVAVPPPAPIGFATLFAQPYPSTHAAAAQAVSTAIDTWMKTGTATPAAGGSPAPWA